MSNKIPYTSIFSDQDHVLTVDKLQRMDNALLALTGNIEKLQTDLESKIEALDAVKFDIITDSTKIAIQDATTDNVVQTMQDTLQDKLSGLIPTNEIIDLQSQINEQKDRYNQLNNNLNSKADAAKVDKIEGKIDDEISKTLNLCDQVLGAAEQRYTNTIAAVQTGISGGKFWKTLVKNEDGTLTEDEVTISELVSIMQQQITALTTQVQNIYTALNTLNTNYQNHIEQLHEITEDEGSGDSSTSGSSFAGAIITSPNINIFNPTITPNYNNNSNLLP